MNKAGLYLIFAMFSTVEVSFADQEAVVIEVRKNLSMGKKDKIYKNFFINGGAKLGLVPGKRVDVIRRLPVHDPIKNASIGDLRVKVGEIEIIHSDNRISVAKLISQESPENRPLLDYEAVMIGDRLDLSSIRDTQWAEANLEQLRTEVAAHVTAATLSEIPGEKFSKVSRQQNLIREGDRQLASLKPSKKSQKKSGKKGSKLSSKKASKNPLGKRKVAQQK